MASHENERTPSSFDNLSRSDLIQHLRKALQTSSPKELKIQRRFHFVTPPIQAAILVPFLYVNGQWNLLFIRRSTTGDAHSGQVAFPGGRMEIGDPSPEVASLRETQEEIGVSPLDVEIVGKLPPLLTVTNFEIHPIVGVIPYPYPFQPSPSEVQKIFTIPISWLADRSNFKTEERHLPPPVGTILTIYYDPYNNEVLWGASAQIVHTLLALIKYSASSNGDEAG